MISEQLEFRISQYADGTLAAEEVPALEAVLASDAEARAMLESYRKLNTAIRAELVTPEANWDRLASQISRSVAAVEEADSSGVWGRIGTWTRFAVAAVIVLAIGSAVWFGSRPGNHVNVAKTNPSTPRVELAEVTGPMAETTTKPGIEEVSIGPAPNAPQLSYAAAEDIVYRAPSVVIASSLVQGQDNTALPF